MRIEWDNQKDLSNRRKHRLSFEEASSLFASGVDYYEIFDEFHSVAEDRFICIGPIRCGLVVVVKTEPDENAVRIISARHATLREARIYWDYVETRRS